MASSGEICREVWPLLVDGQGWLAATNGHLVAAIRRADVVSAAADPALLQLVPYLRAIETPHQYDFETLTAWIGQPYTMPPRPAPADCVFCDGTGEVPEHDDCDDCTHTEPCGDCGNAEPPSRSAPYNHGRIGAAVLNRYELAKIWTHLTPCSVGVRVTSATDPVYFAGTDWRVVLMPLRCDPHVLQAAQALESNDT